MDKHYHTPLFVFCVLLVGALLFGFGYFGSKPFSLQSDSPGFGKLESLPALGQLSYNFLARRPFENGILLIMDRASSRSFAFDLEAGRVVGQLTNAGPELSFGNPPRLLCSQQTQPKAGGNPLSERLRVFLSRISKGRVDFPPRPATGTKYWLLDSKNNRAVQLGFIPGTPNVTLVPSPDFHYCYTLRPPDF
jgi:hypothetical protein